MYGTLIVKEPESDGTVIVDSNGRVIAECKVHADAIDLAHAWNQRPKSRMTPEQWEQFELRR